MDRETREPLSLRLTARCGAKTRGGAPCMRARARGKTRCKLHGGAKGSGAPAGERNGNFKHGLFTAAAMRKRERMRSLLRAMRPSMQEGRDEPFIHVEAARDPERVVFQGYSSGPHARRSWPTRRVSASPTAVRLRALQRLASRAEDHGDLHLTGTRMMEITYRAIARPALRSAETGAARRRSSCCGGCGLVLAGRRTLD